MGKEKFLPAKVVQNLPLSKGTPLPVFPLQVLEEILDWLKERERQKTLRQALEVQREAISKFIEAYGENFDKLFETKVKQRRESLQILLKGIEQALEKENDKQLELLLQTLIAFFDSPIVSDEEYRAILGNALQQLSGANRDFPRGSYGPRKLEW